MHNGGDMIARKMTKFERRTFEIWKFWKGNYPIFSFRLRFFFLVNYACFIILYISTVPFVYLYFSVLKKKKECSIRSNFYQFRIRCNSLGSFQLNTYFIFLVYHLHPEQRLLPFRPFISHSIPLSPSLSSRTKIAALFHRGRIRLKLSWTSENSRAGLQTVFLFNILSLTLHLPEFHALRSSMEPVSFPELQEDRSPRATQGTMPTLGCHSNVLPLPLAPLLPRAPVLCKRPCF